MEHSQYRALGTPDELRPCDELLTVHGLARVTRLDETFIRRAIERREIPSVEPAEGLVLASPSAVRRYRAYLRAYGKGH